MSPCPSGYQNGPVQAVYSVPGSLIHKAMSTTQSVVAQRVISLTMRLWGKDPPLQLGKAEFEEENGKNGGLLLRLTKSIHHTTKYVVLDSGFCVLAAPIALKKVGVFADSLIKKCRYWLTYCQGDAIYTYFKDKEVGSTGSVEGALSGEKYNIWCMKEPDYVCKMFGMAGGLHVMDNREHTRVWTEGGAQKMASFKFAEPFTLHFNYRHAVDDHNNLHHQVLSIKKTGKQFLGFIVFLHS